MCILQKILYFQKLSNNIQLQKIWTPLNYCLINVTLYYDCQLVSSRYSIPEVFKAKWSIKHLWTNNLIKLSLSSSKIEMFIRKKKILHVSSRALRISMWDNLKLSHFAEDPAPSAFARILELPTLGKQQPRALKISSPGP